MTTVKMTASQLQRRIPWLVTSLYLKINLQLLIFWIKTITIYIYIYIYIYIIFTINMHLFAVSFSTCFECKAMFSISYISKTIFARFGNRVSQQYTIMNTNKINRIWTPNLRNVSKDKHRFYPEIVADITTRNWKREDMYFTLNIFYCSKRQKDKTQVKQLRQSSPITYI